MDDFNFAAALRQYREREGAALDEMAKKLNMSRSAYYRLERGEVKPSYERAQKIIKSLQINTLLQQQEISPAAKKWNNPAGRTWVRVLIAILLAWAFLPPFFSQVRIAYGKEAWDADPPYEAIIIFFLVICAFYFYYYPPKRLLGKRENRILSRPGR